MLDPKDCIPGMPVQHITGVIGFLTGKIGDKQVNHISAELVTTEGNFCIAWVENLIPYRRK